MTESEKAPPDQIAPNAVHECESWDDFLARLALLEERFDTRRYERSRLRHVSMVYRGLADASFSLSSTLERSIAQLPAGKDRKSAASVKDYLRAALVARAAIESETGRRWSLDDKDVWGRDRSDSFHPFSTDELSYLLHIRHHGFPSPFLDWTESPLVAAFFAFRSMTKPTCGRVAIHVYREMSDVGGRSLSPLGFLTDTIGNTISTNPRHHRQRSVYTVCLSSGGDSFETFEKGVGSIENPSRWMDMEDPLLNQDLQWRFTIPWSERSRVLYELDRMNLHAYSLMGDEDSLMETLANRAHAMFLPKPATTESAEDGASEGTID